MTTATNKDYFATFACMTAELMEQNREGAQGPPSTEVLIRAIDSIAHYFSRNLSSAATADRAAHLVETLVLRYDHFWNLYFHISKLSDPFYRAAMRAVNFDRVPETREELNELLKDL